MQVNGTKISWQGVWTVLVNAVLVGVSWGLLTAGQTALRHDVDRLYMKMDKIEEHLRGRTP